MTGGLPIRLIAMSSRRRMPPEYVAALRLPASVSEKRASRSSAIPPGFFRWRSLAISTRFSRPLSTSSTAANWPVRLIDSRTSPGFAATSKPLTVAVPASAFSSVERIRTSVVLPAPFEPSSAKMLPALHIEVDAPQHLQVLERLLDAPHPDRGFRGLVGSHVRFSVPGAFTPRRRVGRRTRWRTGRWRRSGACAPC